MLKYRTKYHTVLVLMLNWHLKKKLYFNVTILTNIYIVFQGFSIFVDSPSKKVKTFRQWFCDVQLIYEL